MTDRIPDLSVRRFHPADQAAIQQLYASIFKRARSDRKWRHLYTNNPGGNQQISVVVDSTGRLVGHMATLPFAAKLFDKQTCFALVTDLMLHEAYRGAGRGQIAMELVNVHFEQFGPDQLAYALSNKPAARMAATTDRWRHMHVGLQEASFLTKKVQTVRQRLGKRSIEASVIATVADLGAALWQQRCEDHQIAIVRDAAYLAWRYDQMVDSRYVSLAVTVGARTIGIVILADFAFRERRYAAIVDWIVPLAAANWFSEIISLIEYKAQSYGIDRVLTLFPAWSVEYSAFVSAGYQPTASGYVLEATGGGMGNIVSEASLRSSWYYTLGDFDLL